MDNEKLYVGKVIRTGMSDDTVVIQMSDNGKNAVLWDGRQYFAAFGFKKENEDSYTWESGEYTSSLIAAAALMELQPREVKETVGIFMLDNYAAFFKSLISEELNIDNEEILDELYNEYMNNDDFELLSLELIEHIQDLNSQKHRVDDTYTL